MVISAAQPTNVALAADGQCGQENSGREKRRDMPKNEMSVKSVIMYTVR